MNYQLQPLSIEILSPNPLRPRQTVKRDSLLQLADSIRQYGILVPLIVAKTTAGHQIIAGERRLRAAKLAGKTEVPCLIIEGSEKEVSLISLAENLQREPLNLLDQAAAIQRLQKERGLDLIKIGQRLGLPYQELQARLELLELPDQVKIAYAKGKINDQQLFSLAQINDPVLMIEELKRLV